MEFEDALNLVFLKKIKILRRESIFKLLKK